MSTPGRWLHVELRDFQLANLPGGTQPVMATVTTASAEIEAMSLLHGPLVIRGLAVNGLQVLLEHTSDDCDSGDREQSVHSIMNTNSGDHEHLFAPA